jgi:hypothetical protein
LTKDERIELHSLKEEHEKIKGKLKQKLQTMKTMGKKPEKPLMEACSSDSGNEARDNDVTSSDSEDDADEH